LEVRIDAGAPHTVICTDFQFSLLEIFDELSEMTVDSVSRHSTKLLCDGNYAKVRYIFTRVLFLVLRAVSIGLIFVLTT